MLTQGLTEHKKSEVLEGSWREHNCDEGKENQREEEETTSKQEETLSFVCCALSRGRCVCLRLRVAGRVRL